MLHLSLYSKGEQFKREYVCWHSAYNIACTGILDKQKYSHMIDALMGSSIIRCKACCSGQKGRDAGMAAGDSIGPSNFLEYNNLMPDVIINETYSGN